MSQRSLSDAINLRLHGKMMPEVGVEYNATVPQELMRANASKGRSLMPRSLEITIATNTIEPR